MTNEFSAQSNDSLSMEVSSDSQKHTMNDVAAKLTTIFQNVNEWLKFAEAKNGILLAFSGAALTAPITILSTSQNIPNSLKLGLFLTTILLGICSLICSLSFLPKTNLERLVWLQSKPPRNENYIKKDTDNFWFFEDLKKYTASELLAAMNEHYFEGELTELYKKEYQDIAQQITINAGITSLKYQIFTYALYVLIASIVVIPCLILGSLIISNNL